MLLNSNSVPSAQNHAKMQPQRNVPWKLHEQYCIRWSALFHLRLDQQFCAPWEPYLPDRAAAPAGVKQQSRVQLELAGCPRFKRSLLHKPLRGAAAPKSMESRLGRPRVSSESPIQTPTPQPQGGSRTTACLESTATWEVNSETVGMRDSRSWLCLRPGLIQAFSKGEPLALSALLCPDLGVDVARRLRAFSEAAGPRLRPSSVTSTPRSHGHGVCPFLHSMPIYRITLRSRSSRITQGCELTNASCTLSASCCYHGV